MTNNTNNTSHLRRTSVSLLTLMGVLYGLPASALDQAALPQGGTVASGSATINYSANAPKLDINQASHAAVIDWNSFNIGEKATTEFHQPDAKAIAVNRVHDGSPSQILGSLKANGNVVVLNQNGVMFGQNATVDVGGLIASTGTLNEDKFNQTGAVELSNLQTGGKIQNDGKITVADRGLAAFVAPEVVNNGVITAKLGRIELAAGGTRATVDLYGDKLVELALDETATKAIATNTGTLQADGGLVAMSADAVEGVVNNIVNAGGIIQANSVDTTGGRIVLTGNNANIAATGQISAKGTGAANGGTIKVKSNKSIWVSKQAKLDASAGTVGHGGTIDIIADKTAKITGTVKARGGSLQGDGGTIDTSGHERVDITGTIDAGATNGKAGSWTIDPRDLIIQDTRTTDVSGDGSEENPYASNDGFFFPEDIFANNIFFPFGPSYLDATTVRNALDKNTSLYITTVGTPGPIILEQAGLDEFSVPFFPFFQNGDITINADLNVTGGNEASLNLNAAGSIFFGDLNTNGISSTAGLNLAFIAGNDIFINRDITVQGAVGLNAGGDVHINGMVRTGGGDAMVAGNQVLIGDNFTLPSGPFIPYVLAFPPIIIPSGMPGLIDAQGGDILITNTDRFLSVGSDTLLTSGAGTITLNQYANGSLQNAVDALGNTGTGLSQLNAKTGTYNEQLNLTQANFRLQGDGSANTIIQAPLMSSLISEGGVTTQAVIAAVDTDRVAIDGVAVQGGLFNFADRSFDIYLLRSDHSAVTNSSTSGVLFGGSTAGIALQDSTYALIQSNSITGANTGVQLTGASTDAQIDKNTIDGQGFIFFAGGTTGVFGDATSTNVSVTQNTISNVTGDGIYIAHGAITVSGNTITNVQNGIRLSDSDAALAGGNAIDQASNTGIRIDGSNGILVFGNVINNTTNNPNVAGIVLDNSGTLFAPLDPIGLMTNVVFNTVTGTQTGITVSNADDALVDFNTVDVSGDAITVSDLTAVTVDTNTVTAAATGVSVIRSNAIVSNNAISGITQAGFYTAGTGNFTVTLLDNTVTSQNDGALFTAGTIDFQGINRFSSLNDGLVFDPVTVGAAPGVVAVAGNTFGTTVLTDQVGYYIRLANGALFNPGTPTILDATQVNFDGRVYGGGAIPAADLAAIESRLFDFDDMNTLGQIFVASAIVPPVIPPVVPPVVPPVIPPAGPGTPVATVDPTTILPDQAIARSSLSRVGSVTITGLPFAPGAIPASVLAGLDSAAGGDGNGSSGVGLSATQLNDLDSAAGGETASCWGDVYSHFGQRANTAVTFSLDTAPQSLFNAQTRCNTASGI